MNVVATKLKEAGVKLPSVKYRIWNWLRDHPEKTVSDIATALGLGYEPAQAILEMEKGGVVKVFSDMSRGTGGNGQSYKIKRYSVSNAKEYENVTKGRIARMKPMRSVPAAQQVRKEAAPLVTFEAPVPQVITLSNLDSLTIDEARAIYAKLKEMFK